MTDVMTELAGQRDEDLAKKAQESPLTPEGRYKFQVEAVTVRVGDKEFWDAEETRRNVFFGKQVARLQLKLTSKRDGMKKDSPWITLDRPLRHFVNVCPETVLDAKGELSIESKLFGQMSAIAKDATTNAEVINYFKDNFGEINIGVSQANEEKGYSAKNWNRGISAVA